MCRPIHRRLGRSAWALVGVALAIVVLWLAGLVLQRVTLDGEWLLEAGARDGLPIPVAANDPPSLRIEGGRLSGRGPCNEYNGFLDVSGGLFLDVSSGSFHPHDIFHTLAECLDNPLMQSEDDYLAALSRVSRFRLDGGRLILSGSGVELQFKLNTAPYEGSPPRSQTGGDRGKLSTKPPQSALIAGSPH